MDRRGFLAAGLRLAVGLGAVLAAAGRAWAAIDLPTLKGNFSFTFQSNRRGQVTGTFRVKKNKPEGNPGVRELTGNGTSSLGKFKGWVVLVPTDEGFSLHWSRTKKKVTTAFSGEATVSPDGTTFSGAYRISEGREGHQLIQRDFGTFVIVRI
jgi:hypothetical protein